VFIELVTGSTSRLLDMVQRYEVDAALISEPFTAPELATQKAFDEELVLIAARSATGVLDPEQLSRCTVIAFPAGCSYRRILEEWFASTELLLTAFWRWRPTTPSWLALQPVRHWHHAALHLEGRTC
jgi:DNA-binding transcriptional LysR family regulator